VEGELETAAARRLDLLLWSKTTDCAPLLIFEELVGRLLAPDRIRGVPENLRQPALLRDHLLRVFALTERTAWFIVPLIMGLLECHSSINVRPD
jgi:hypothetical protein